MTIVKAHGLLDEDWSSKSDPYCICQVMGKKSSQIKTEIGSNPTDPVWNHGPVEMAEYEEGDALEFEVFDKDWMMDDSLGQVALEAKEFAFPQKFVGALMLTGKYAGKAKLEVRVMDHALVEDDLIEQEEARSPASPSRPASRRTRELAGSSSPTGYSSPKSRDLSAAVSEKDFAQKKVTDWHARDQVCSSVEGLKRTLISKYGSCFSAWRQILDPDNKGRMSQADFTIACRQLGIKAIGRLWAELEPTGGSGSHVMLADVDLATEEAFRELEERLLSEFPNTKAGWKTVFDPNRTRRSDAAMFKAGCERIHYAGNPEKTFKLLRPYPGAKHLSYEDLWPNYDRNEVFPDAESSKAGARMASPCSALNLVDKN